MHVHACAHTGTRASFRTNYGGRTWQGLSRGGMDTLFQHKEGKEGLKEAPEQALWQSGADFRFPFLGPFGVFTSRSASPEQWPEGSRRAESGSLSATLPGGQTASGTQRHEPGGPSAPPHEAQVTVETGEYGARDAGPQQSASLCQGNAPSGCAGPRAQAPQTHPPGQWAGYRAPGRLPRAKVTEPLPTSSQGTQSGDTAGGRQGRMDPSPSSGTFAAQPPGARCCLI